MGYWRFLLSGADWLLIDSRLVQVHGDCKCADRFTLIIPNMSTNRNRKATLGLPYSIGLRTGYRVELARTRVATVQELWEVQSELSLASVQHLLREGRKKSLPRNVFKPLGRTSRKPCLLDGGIPERDSKSENRQVTKDFRNLLPYTLITHFVFLLTTQ